MLGKLVDLDPDVVHGALDLRLPLLHRSRSTLELRHAHILSNREICKLAFPLVIGLGETGLPLLLRLRELLF
jgi:hypothetical protein